MGVLAVVIGSGFYWLSGGRWVDSDDAYVQADSMTLSTDVSGIVASIPVHEGEAVTKGQILFSLDPLKFQIGLDKARADLAQVRLNIEAMKAVYQAATPCVARIRSARDDLGSTVQAPVWAA